MTRSAKVRAVSIAVVVIGSSTALATPHAAAAPTAHHHHVRGDLDGDGRPDLAIGAPGGDRVRVTYSHAKPAGSHVQSLALPEAAAGPAEFGAVLVTGDFNADGFSDLAVMAPGWTDPVTHGDNPESQGAMYLYRGSATGLHEDVTVHGPYNGEDPYNLGSMAATGDINHDGYADLVLKVEGGDTQQILAYYGSHSGLDTAHPQPFDDFGAASMALADINHDHFADLILADNVDLSSSSIFEGDVQVIFGSAGGLTNHHRQKIPAKKFGVRIGFGSATTAGDINHDGFADVVIGDAAASHFPNHLSPGKIVVLLGGKHGLSAKRHRTIDEKASKLAKHTSTKDRFGATVAIGTVNGDKYPDVVVGAPGVRVGGRPGAGAVYVLRGTKSGVSTKHVHRFTQAGKVPGKAQRKAHFGAAVRLSPLGGRSNDAVIGAPQASYGAAAGGFVAILRSTARGLTTKHAKGIRDAVAGDNLGAAIAGPDSTWAARFAG